MGAVAEFDTSGNFLKQLIAGSQLASPWGITLAPLGFGPFGGDLLVGNFSFAASEINAFDPITGAFLGTIPIDTGSASPGGLWSLAFGKTRMTHFGRGSGTPVQRPSLTRILRSRARSDWISHLNGELHK
jgi:hypothetical protein